MDGRVVFFWVGSAGVQLEAGVCGMLSKFVRYRPPMWVTGPLAVGR